MTSGTGYQTFLRELIGPALRELGFRGSRGSFVLPDERYWALVGFHADWRDARMGRACFTVNLTVASKAAWEAARAVKSYYPARPTASSSSGMEPAEVIRIGALVPVHDLLHDRWWCLDAAGGPERVAEEVIATIRDHGLPWLRSRMKHQRRARVRCAPGER